ncbi:MAG: sigma-70 family RNA polymerase sigma factor [Eubacteriales bacterium]|nr:sigma-70 family RNA polymerase sigma factor [Eubacteriales bacterium]
MEDEKIIELFFLRDERAIAETEALYGAKLYRIADKILRNSEDAEESVSDTYLSAWNTIPPQKPVYFFAYLARICRHFAFGKLDWKNAEKRRADIVELTLEMERCIPDKGFVMDMDGKEIGRLLDCFLDGLPYEKRMIFIRRYWYTDTIQEISARYGISQSKVKTCLHRTRKKLHDFLECEGVNL